jgi:hypothetical protein
VGFRVNAAGSYSNHCKSGGFDGEEHCLRGQMQRSG